MTDAKNDSTHPNEVADSLQREKNRVLAEWERRARQELFAAEDKSVRVLTNDLPHFLDEMIRALRQSAPDLTRAGDAAKAHAIQRFTIPDYTLEQVLAEYRILLQVIFDVLSEARITVSGRDRNTTIDLIHRAKASAARQYTEEALKREKEISQALAISESRFRQMFEFAGIGKVITDPKTLRILQVNPAFCKMLGYSEAELKGMTFRELTHPDDLETVRIYEKLSQQPGAHWSLEKRYLTKNGQTLWASIYATTLTDPMGSNVVLASVIDISDRRKIEAEKSMVEQLRDHLLSRLQSLQVVSEAALSNTTTLAELLHKSVEIIASRIHCDTVAILLYNEDDDSVEIRAGLGFDEEVLQKAKVSRGHGIAGKILASGESMRVDDLRLVENVSPMLTAKDVRSLIGVPLRAKGKILGIIHVGRVTHSPFSDDDLNLLELIADRLATAIDIAQLYENLQETVHRLQIEKGLREQFVNTLTHDLRNPLSAAKTSAQLIARNPNQADRVTALSIRMVSAIDRADRMIQDLLDTNRIRAGNPLLLELAECDVVELARQVIDEFISIHGPRFDFKAPDTLLAKVSSKEIIRLIENLVSNAIKYGSDANVGITLEVLPNDWFQISVHNEGNPIPLKEQSRLFDPYARLSGAEASGKKGWGLGLTLVRGVAEAHHGTVKVVSNEKEGTTFIVSMPRN